MKNQLKDNLLPYYSVGSSEVAVLQEMNYWQAQDKVTRLWNGDSSLWTSSDEHQWMGWLCASLSAMSSIPHIETLLKEILACGYTNLALLGMGGASLCPDLFAKTFGKIEKHPRLKVLDSIDPVQIRRFEEDIDLKNTLFIVSSKSGKTLESLILKKYFFKRLQTILGKAEVGSQFLAITDPGTELANIASCDKFKAIFYGVPSIGGRVSALSNFGIVPLGLMGINIKQFLEYAVEMEIACSPRVFLKNNPGVTLGIILGVCAREGKDKVTLVVSPAIYALGAWITQLLAESTGKNGKGLIPIDQEPLGAEDVYGHDRVFVYLRLECAPDVEQDMTILKLEQLGYAVVRLTILDIMHLGAELFRWQIATAVAGSIIGIHPFNQPDVEVVKERAWKLSSQVLHVTTSYQSNLIFSEAGIQLFTDKINECAILQLLRGEPSITSYLSAHLSRANMGDYFNLCAFLAMKEEHMALLQQIRILIRQKQKLATSLGFGSRYLHSVGQIHKGGPNTGLFIQITADFSNDIPVPEQPYTFGLVLAMQAQADFEILTQRARRFLRIHLGYDVNNKLQQLCQFMSDYARDA